MVWAIERLQKEDIHQVIGMVRTSILGISPRFYNQEQRTAWAEGIKDQPHFHQRFLEAYALVAKDDHNNIIGFASLVDAHIDFLYVASGKQRKGLATQMLDLLEERAKEKGVKVLTTEASAVARPFFQKRGFVIKEEQVIGLGEIEMKNVQMFKKVLK